MSGRQLMPLDAREETAGSAVAATPGSAVAARPPRAAAAGPDQTPRGRVRRMAGIALDLALPPLCAGCGREGVLLCPACGRRLDGRLGLPVGTPLGLPTAMPQSIVQLEWCAPFSGAVRRTLHRLKYAGERRLAAPLGSAMGRRWRVAGAGGDLLVPVPIHEERARRRGYDQAALLAREAARELDLPWRPALRRLRATPPQFELGRQARATNVAGAFGLRRAADAAAVRGRWVVLVDDVVTTGATLAACAAPLYEAGAMAVSALTVARER